MIAWLRVRIEAVRQDLREARAALAASRRELKTAKAELRAAEHEHARLQKASRKPKTSDKSPDVDPAALAAARLAVDTARATVDEVERGLVQRQGRRKELRTSLEELIDELQTRGAAVP
jgi:chromosome segregation ATPase